jgi:hypothetical protein
MQKELIAGIGDAFLELFEDEIRSFKRMLRKSLLVAAMHC